MNFIDEFYGIMYFIKLYEFFLKWLEFGEKAEEGKKPLK